MKHLKHIDGVLSVVASTDSPDSHGEKVVQDFDLSRYLNNPVVLWEHGQYAHVDPCLGLPIGKAENVRVEDGQLLADIRLATSAANPFMPIILAQIEQGTLRGVSIRTRPSATDNNILTGNELIEISLVSIGSNPDTVIEHFKSIRKKDIMEYTENDFKNLVSALSESLGLSADSTPETIVAAVQKLVAEKADVKEALAAEDEENLAEKASALAIKNEELEATSKGFSRVDALKALIESAEKQGKCSPAVKGKLQRHGEKFGLDSLKSLIESLPQSFSVAFGTTAKSTSKWTSEQLEFARRNGIKTDKLTSVVRPENEVE